MRKIFCITLLGALLCGTTACKKDKNDDKATAGTVSVNARTENVRSVYYTEEPADEENEPVIGMLILGNEGAPGAVEPEFYVTFEISESLLGKTIDLSTTLPSDIQPLPYLAIAARNGAAKFTIYYDEDPVTQKVSRGSLRVIRQGNEFDIAFSIVCADGNSAEVTWKGTATEVPAR